MNLDEFQNIFSQRVSAYLSQSFPLSVTENYVKLVESIRYSLFSNGKRFRPYLTYLVGQSFGADFEKTWWAGAAVEFVHTYSLIHDDLPCMDNDDYRRGQLTNHKVYGESLALLAGDALLTQAFDLLTNHDNTFTPNQKVNMVQRLVLAAGARGMIAGQVMDMAIDQNSELAHPDYLQKMHSLKTANLIEVSGLMGLLAAVEKPSEIEIKSVQNYSVYLGLAFQVQDDILDYHSEKIAPKNMARVFGITSAEKYRDELAQKAIDSLNEIKINSESKKNLVRLIENNSSRGF